VAAGIPRGIRAVIDDAGTLGRKILEQRSPQRHVDELYASTDAQDGQLSLPRNRKQRELEEVALATGRAQQR
jgi:hypothetical protein